MTTLLADDKGYAEQESDMDWHLDSAGRPCACLEEEHDHAERISWAALNLREANDES